MTKGQIAPPAPAATRADVDDAVRRFLDEGGQIRRTELCYRPAAPRSARQRSNWYQKSKYNGKSF